jgi:hypothetical protein
MKIRADARCAIGSAPVRGLWAIRRQQGGAETQPGLSHRACQPTAMLADFLHLRSNFRTIEESTSYGFKRLRKNRCTNLITPG